MIFVFHGMSTAFLQRRNIAIDLIDTFAHRTIVAALIRLSDVLTIVTLGLFAYAMITPAMQSYNYGEIKMDLQIPIWWMWVDRAHRHCRRHIVRDRRAVRAAGSPPHRRAGLMAASSIGAIGVFALFAMLLFRVPVWIALTLVGFIGNSIMSGIKPTFALAGTVPFDVGASYNLSVLPLFILMGEVASVTGLSSDLFKAARVVLAGVRGGLAVGALAASACFGAVCGSSLATAATMTRIALPDMRKAGYDPGLAVRRARRRRQPRHSHSAVDHSGDLCGDLGAIGAAPVRRRTGARPGADRALHAGGARRRQHQEILRAGRRERADARSASSP